MSKKGKMRTGVLSDHIANLLTITPGPDVEDDQVFDTKPKIVNKEDLDLDSDGGETAVLSSFRKQSVNLLADISCRYQGAPTSKRELGLESSSSDISDIDSDGSEIQDESESTELEKDSDAEDSVGENGSKDSREGEQFRHVREDEGEDTARGMAVRAQLSLWEGLLEQRIALQRPLSSARRLPVGPDLKELCAAGGPSLHAAVARTKGNVATLLNRLMELQTLLVSSYPETNNLSKHNKSRESSLADPMDEEILSDPDSPDLEESTGEDKTKIKRKRKLADYCEELSIQHRSYAAYRDSVIQKWFDKTRTAVGRDKHGSTTTSTLSQIEFVLRDRSRLIKRTQMKRTDYDLLGFKEKDHNVEVKLSEDLNRQEIQENLSPENFDDDDFYHQLLRELIEHKSADVSDPVQLSRQWIMLQQMRSKMKRKVDTRATKGRRIRYAVHSKLVNYMAPEVGEDWTADSKNELYASLFGKQFEGNVNNIKISTMSSTSSTNVLN